MTPEEIMQNNRNGLVKSKKTGKTGYVSRVDSSNNHNPDSHVDIDEKLKEYSYWVIWSGKETPELVREDDLVSFL